MITNNDLDSQAGTTGAYGHIKDSNVWPISAALGNASQVKSHTSHAYSSSFGDKSAYSESELGTMLSEEGSDSMQEFSKEELNATLGQHKAEINAIASEMRREMAEWREQSNAQLSQLTISINALSSKLDGKMDSVDGDIKAIAGKFEGFNGQMTGINTAISGIQSGISTRLAVFGVIIAVIVAIPGLVSALKDTSSPVQTTSQPIVIQVPQQPAPVQQLPETNKPK